MISTEELWEIHQSFNRTFKKPQNSDFKRLIYAYEYFDAK